MKLLCLYLVSIFFSLGILCSSLPTDPSSVPGNASVHLVAVDGVEDYFEPIKINEGATSTVTFTLYLENFIDSVTIDVKPDDIVSEYHAVTVKPWNSTTITVDVPFRSSGTRKVEYTAWINNNTTKTYGVVFDIIARPANAAPVIVPETIELFSEEGVNVTRNLMPYIYDYDNDNVYITLPNQNEATTFNLNDSLLSSTSEMDAGNYILTLTASDGLKSTGGTVLWRVYTPPQGSSELHPDVVSTVRNMKIVIDAIANDIVPSGSLLSFSSQGTNGKTYLSDGKIHYRPNTGYVGSDTLLYLVNGRDTGRVVIHITESTVPNRAPEWVYDTIELYSPSGVSTTGNIGIFLRDPDNDSLIYTITLPENEGFVTNRSVIASTEALAVGTYNLPVYVSDGIASVPGLVMWHVYETANVEVTTKEDVVEIENDGPVTIDVLGNDVVVSGEHALLVTDVLQGDNGVAVIKNGTLIIYTPDDGFTGSDTVGYMINGKDTGWVVITTAGVTNNSPEWVINPISHGSPQGAAGGLNLNQYATDRDGDTLTFTIAAPGVVGFTITSDSLLSTDGSISAGEYTLTIHASDGDTGSAVSVVWTVASATSETVIAIVNDSASVTIGESVTIPVLLNDRVVSGAAHLSLTSVSEGENGTVTISAAGLIYTSQTQSAGIDSFYYIVNSSDTGWVFITITDIPNSPPVWGMERISHGSLQNTPDSMNLKQYVTDADNDPLLFTLHSESPQGFLLVNDSILVTAGNLAPGDFSLSVTVSDGILDAPASVVWTILAPTEAVLGINDDSASGPAGAQLTIEALNNDLVISGEALLSITSVSNGKNGTVLIDNNRLMYTPDAEFWGTDTFFYIVNATDTGLVFITVLKPEVSIQNDELAVPENGTGVVNVLRNDTISSGSLSIISLTGGNKGTVTIQGDSSVTYQANTDASGLDTIRYILNSGDTGSVVVTIKATEYTLNNDTVAVLQGRTRKIDVLANDNISNGVLKVTSVTTGTLGTVTYTDSSLLYTASAGVTGSEEITYVVNQGKGSAKVTIQVLAIEITAVNDAISVDEDSGPTTIDVCANDIISEGETLTLTGVTGGKLGNALVEGGHVLYTPESDSFGVDTLHYTVNNITEGTLTVTINPTPDMPIFTIAELTDTVYENETISLQFEAVDPDKTPVTFRITGNPPWVTIGNTTGSVQISVAPGNTAVSHDSTVSFTIQAESGNNSTAKTVIIRVINGNQPPYFVNAPVTIDVYENKPETFEYTAVDPDNDNITITVISKPEWATTSTTDNKASVTVAQHYSFLTAALPTKSGTLKLRATDGKDTAFCQTTITIHNVNRAPVFKDLPSSIVPYVDDSVTIDLSEYGYDADGNALSYSLVQSLDGMVIEGTMFKWLVPYGASQGTITLQVKDYADSSQENVAIMVTSLKEWTAMNTSILCTDATYWTAQNGSTLFMGEKGADGFMRINKYTNGGRTGPTEVDNIDWVDNDATYKWFFARGEHLYLGGSHTATHGFFGAYSFDGNTDNSWFVDGKDYEIITSNAFDVSPDEHTVFFQYLAQNPNTVGQGQYAFVGNTQDGSSDEKKAVDYAMTALVCGNTYQWAKTGTYTIKQTTMASYSTGSPVYETYSTSPDAIDNIFGDNGSGSTVYATTAHAIHVLTVGEPITKIPVSFTPSGICMKDENTGWVWDTDGKVYYTTNKFSNITKELCLAADNTIAAIAHIFVSGNGTTVFATSKVSGGKTMLFRN